MIVQPREIAWLTIALSLAACSDRPLPIPLAGDMAPPDLARPDNLGTIPRACATLVTCRFSDLVATSMNYCLTAWSELISVTITDSAYQQMFQCISDAGADCAKAASCLDQAQTHQPCPGKPSCDGTAVLGCLPGSQVVESFDCASIGAQCFVYDDGTEAGCGFDRCVNAQTVERGCFQDRVGVCFSLRDQNDAIFRVDDDCAAFGGVCSDMPNTRCVFPRCDPHMMATCIEGYAVTCDGSGKLSRQACNPIGCTDGSCNQTTMPFFGCDFTASCEDGVLSVCGLKIDCVGLGFAGCDPSNGGRCTR